MTTIGIDLGTTNSVAAHCAAPGGSPRVLTNAAGERRTPSVVGVRTRRGEPGPVTVGQGAIDQAGFAPEDTIVSVKRLMGRSIDEDGVATIQDRVAYRIVAGEDGDGVARVLMGGRRWTPAEISGEILRAIAEQGRKSLGEPVTGAVITVPAHFENVQRQATLDAGVTAGLDVLKVIDEPTAAAVAFGAAGAAGENHFTLVYDLGGGTFDVSLLAHTRSTTTGANFTVMAMTGDLWLGGDDFDAAIVDRIVESVQNEHGIDPRDDARFVWAVKQAAERAKKTLTEQDQVAVQIPAAYNPPGGPTVDVDVELRRADFEDMIAPFVDRTLELVTGLLAERSMSMDMISDVLLVGGATLTPMVFRRVEKYFGQSKVRRDIDPMEVVALGASLIAQSLGGRACPSCGTTNPDGRTDCRECGEMLPAGGAPTRLNELTARSVGIASVRGKDRDAFAPIIPRGTRYPLAEPCLRTFRSTGRRLRLPIYEGEEPRAGANSAQGVVEYELPTHVESETLLEVEFDYTPDRILEVTIRVPGAQVEVTRRVEPESQRAAPPPPTDLRNELAGLLDTATTMVERYGNYMDTRQRRGLEQSTERARTALEDPSERALRRALDDLDTHLAGCGVATQLFLADRVVAVGLASDLVELIEAERRRVDEAMRRGDRDGVAEHSRSLRVAIGQARNRIEGRDSQTAAGDFGGLLRQLEDE